MKLDEKGNLKKAGTALILSLTLVVLYGCTITQPAPAPEVATSPPPSSAAAVTPPSSSAPPSPAFATGPVYTPSAARFTPTGPQADLVGYALELINADRKSAGVEPVTLSYNAAAQKHAQDMFDNFYLAHWDTDGQKPYMRYTLEGGLNYEQENSAYSGYFDRKDDPQKYANIDPKLIINKLENAMMHDDAKANWGHRDAIINKLHKKVNIGLAYDTKRLALVQQFEGDYVEYIQPPTLSGNMLSLSGKLGLGAINNITICYDELPQALSSEELFHGEYHVYSLGEREAYVIKPAPPGQFYKNLPAEAIQATTWNTNESGQFNIQADISQALSKGKGVYTIVIVSEESNESLNLTNYSIFVK